MRCDGIFYRLDVDSTAFQVFAVRSSQSNAVGSSITSEELVRICRTKRHSLPFSFFRKYDVPSIFEPGRSMLWPAFSKFKAPLISSIAVSTRISFANWIAE